MPKGVGYGKKMGGKGGKINGNTSGRKGNKKRMGRTGTKKSGGKSSGKMKY